MSDRYPGGVAAIDVSVHWRFRCRLFAMRHKRRRTRSSYRAWSPSRVPSPGNYICPTCETVGAPKVPRTVSPAKPSNAESAIFKHRRLTCETVRLIGDTVKKFRPQPLTLSKRFAGGLTGPGGAASCEAIRINVSGI